MLEKTISVYLSFDIIPRKYKIDTDMYIADFGDCNVEEAEKIVKDNVALVKFLVRYLKKREFGAEIEKYTLSYLKLKFIGDSRYRLFFSNHTTFSF